MLRKIWFLIRYSFKEKFIIPRAVEKKKKIKRGNRIIEIPDVEAYIYALPKGHYVREMGDLIAGKPEFIKLIADAVEYMEYGDEVDNDIKYIHEEIDYILQQALVYKR